jgi:hypothetical protein
VAQTTLLKKERIPKEGGKDLVLKKYKKHPIFGLFFFVFSELGEVLKCEGVKSLSMEALRTQFSPRH